jgi:hypothetical protein
MRSPASPSSLDGNAFPPILRLQLFPWTPPDRRPGQAAARRSSGFDPTMISRGAHRSTDPEQALRKSEWHGAPIVVNS